MESDRCGEVTAEQLDEVVFGHGLVGQQDAQEALVLVGVEGSAVDAAVDTDDRGGHAGDVERQLIEGHRGEVFGLGQVEGAYLRGVVGGQHGIEALVHVCVPDRYG